MTKPKIYTMTFASVYPLYIQKAERKNRTQAEVDEIIYWLTGYDEKGQLIKGVICGYRVEEIEDPLMQKIRYLDKLIDELAKGKAMEKILRT
ncbi:DUF2200 domain-containing protein [Enterococcus faecalis]|uniref:DUF2200 domain-containing protein n=1 Tax=Enterococcus faecalis TaxID=1351 RepID=UPI00325BA785